MKSVLKTFEQIDDLTLTELKPLGAMLGKLMEEVGELAVAVNVYEGHITHKVLDEPPVGEVADVIQCAFSILCRIYKDLTPQERLKLFSEYFSNKTDKWERVQKNEIAKAHVPKVGPQNSKHDEGDFADTRKRTIKIIQEQLGCWNGLIEDTSHFVNDLGADSLDLVELVMALEDEFNLEFHDDDELERTTTVRQAIKLVCTYSGVHVPNAEDEIANLTDAIEAEDDTSQEISEDSVDGVFISTPHTVEDTEVQDFHQPPAGGYHLGYRERIHERTLAHMREQEYQQNKRDTKNHGAFGD